MSNNNSSTSDDGDPSETASISDQRLIDKQMRGVIEAILAQSFSLANKGLIPSEPQIAAYVDSLDEEALLKKIRRHPGAASTRAWAAEDAELLRWARLIGR